jgi:hypothetical protein
MDYKNKHCEIAANLLDTEPDLLDYRLVERLNQVADLVKKATGSEGSLRSRQVIALIIIQWQGENNDNRDKKA